MCKLWYFFSFRLVLGRVLLCILNGTSHHYIKKAGNFVRLLDRVTNRKQPKSPISKHLMAIIIIIIIIIIITDNQMINCSFACLA